jgi:hypothetical protein
MARKEFNLSQINHLINVAAHACRPESRRTMRRGIDYKTHSQCQRRRPDVAYLAPNFFGQDPFSSSLEFRLAGGAYRDRTDDPLLAKQVLSQLS